MRYKLFFLLLMSTFTLFKAYAQNFQVPYKPVNLGENINSKYNDMNPVPSQDGTRLYFSRINHPDNNYGKYSSQDIWYSDLQENGQWGEAKHAGKSLNLARYNAVYGVFDNGNTLLINGVFDKNNQWKDRGISFIYRINDTWSDPEEVKVRRLSNMCDGQAFFAYMHPSKKYLLLSFSKQDEGKNNNIYISKKKGSHYSKPKKIKASSFFHIDQAPVMSPTADTVFFASNQSIDEKRDKENLDIFFIVKKDNKFKKWTDPKPVKKANTMAWESYYRLSHKGDVAFFCSNRNNKANADIYAYRRWDDQPYIEVNGKLLDEKTDQPIPSANQVNLLVHQHQNDTTVTITPDSLHLSSDGSYYVQLPLQHDYTIEAKAKGYKNNTISIEGKNLYNHYQTEKQLYLTPEHHAILSVLITDQSTEKPLEDTESVVISINDTILDTTKIKSSGWFEVKIPLGKQSTITVEADGYNPGEIIIDLREHHEYEEISKSIALEKKATTYTLKGNIINKKDNQPISAQSVEVLVNGNNNKANVDEGSYEVNLEEGKYYISVEAEDYIPLSDSVYISSDESNSKDFALTPLIVGEKVAIDHVYFASGKAELKSSSFTSLDKVIKLMNNHQQLRIEIGGHTDNVGKAAFNKQLSKDRAEAVKEYLISQGITAGRVTTEGYGQEQPHVSNDTPENRALNRRVEIKVIGL